MQYADFLYYIEVYHGRQITTANEFDSLEVKARAYIDRVTYGRAQAVCDTDAVKKAVCAACEVYHRYEAGEGISSENNDGYSVTYKFSLRQMSNSLRRAAALYLPAELLYQGVDI